MYIAIVGSREYPDLDSVRDFVLTLNKSSVIVSGGARGVDKRAEEIAIACGLDTVIIYPQWNRWGRGAGMRRNRHIVALAETVVAFWDGKSSGTRNAMALAREMGKHLTVITPQDSPRENS